MKKKEVEKITAPNFLSLQEIISSMISKYSILRFNPSYD